MWQRFTERARRVIFFAQEEATSQGEGYVGTEHLLLGLIRESDSVAGRILDRLGIPVAQIRDDIARQVVRGRANLGQEMQLSPRGSRVIDLAYEESRNLDNKHIGTEHLLLALIREGDGLGARILTKLGATLERVRNEVARMQAGGHLIAAEPEATRILLELYDQLGDDAKMMLEHGVVFSGVSQELRAAIHNAAKAGGWPRDIASSSVIYFRVERSAEASTSVEISLQMTAVVRTVLAYSAPAKPEEPEVPTLHAEDPATGAGDNRTESSKAETPPES